MYYSKDTTFYIIYMYPSFKEKLVWRPVFGKRNLGVASHN